MTPKYGLLDVFHEYLPIVARVLPPEHRVLASKAGKDCDTLLVEGPFMPSMDFSNPDRFDIIIRREERLAVEAWIYGQDERKWEILEPF